MKRLAYSAELIPICGLPLILKTVAEENRELEALTESLFKIYKSYKTKISADKTKRKKTAAVASGTGRAREEIKLKI